MSTPSASKSGADAPHSLKIMNNDSKNSIPIIPVSDVPSRPLNEDNEIFQNSKDGVNMGPSNRNKKSVAVKKLEKRIIRLTAQAITDFGMIEDGDRVMVAMSGGKDSFVLLDALRTLQKRAPIKFDLVAVNVDQHIPNFPREALEQYFKDMQDIEFTIQDGKLWMLQCRNGKRTGAAMVKIAMDMLREGLIDEKTAVLRCEPAKLDELLHPVFDKKAIANAQVITKGLPASPGAATGPVVFFAEDAEKVLEKTGQRAILVRIETSPEDLKGMLDAAGILTARGGMTSHAAVVARGMGKCCVSGAGELQIDYKARTIQVNGFTVKEGDWISLNGSTGEVYLGQVATKAADLSGDFGQLMDLAGKYSVLKVRANADTPKDAAQAFAFGAEGIGLCRTEHMFFEGDRIKAIREMILADDEAGRRVALAKLLPIQRGDFEGLFKAMNGYPVTVRLLDPPLHEFVPHDEKGQKEMAAEMGVPLQKIVAKVESLAEFNPMLGHRGCRLGNTYPEITEMQARAIIEAAMNVKATGIPVHVEIMVPLVGNHKELRYQKNIIDTTAEQVFSERNDKIDYMVGTMIEVPRAAVTANQIAEVAEFFSFGTNDLTQMTLGFSRDDIGKFLPVYLEKGILKNDPFQILDRNGVGQLIREAVFKGRGTRENLKCGICGEHGGEPSSVEFCHYAGLNYVSCSPFRVPIARLAAAHAALNQK